MAEVPGNKRVRTACTYVPKPCLHTLLFLVVKESEIYLLMMNLSAWVLRYKISYGRLKLFFFIYPSWLCAINTCSNHHIFFHALPLLQRRRRRRRHFLPLALPAILSSACARLGRQAAAAGEVKGSKILSLSIYLSLFSKFSTKFHS